MAQQSPGRREFLKTAGAALTASLFPGSIRGANDKVNVAFIGVGRMGSELARGRGRRVRLQPGKEGRQVARASGGSDLIACTQCIQHGRAGLLDFAGAELRVR